ncbi:NAD(P)-binding protein [Paraphaeosphaeria sporulosa]|uniref:NAD(P)-binding protein n=1 Tax=Paraphaeosphaeria sporulosa TaxID=1460663 RepID=A0A177BYY2_9PLEO|nr:NAD(P)-binding protein [Paraphaeosphaeria sporulosa]OAF99636.1 NAD(P)-binding protein [Paraphaeosphaeria sporulosa]
MSFSATYNPDADIPDLSGKVILVTGATTGLGKQTIITLAKHAPSRIFFTGRNVDGAKATMEEAKAISPKTACTYVTADHTSLESRISAAIDRLDIVICNAGIMGDPAGLSKNGYEVQFSINYLSHALLITHLQQKLQDSAENNGDACIVLLSSNGFRFTPRGGVVFQDLTTTQENLGMGSKWLRYGQSKLALVLYAKLLARKYPKIRTVAIHPGVVYTGLGNNLPLGDRL